MARVNKQVEWVSVNRPLSATELSARTQRSDSLADLSMKHPVLLLFLRHFG